MKANLPSMEAISQLLKSKNDKCDPESSNCSPRNLKRSSSCSESEEEQEMIKIPKFEAPFSISNILNLAGNREEGRSCKEERKEEEDEVESQDEEPGTSI